jgi:hypothetical protein
MVNLGDRVKVAVVGLVGICTTKAVHLYGCDRVGVQAEGLDKNGKPHETYWFDEMAVEVVKPAAVKGDTREEKTGGPALPGQIPTRDNPK